MKRRDFIKILSASALPALSGCALVRLSRIDTWNVLLRSDVIQTLEQERAVVDKAHTEWSEDGRVRVLFVKGSPYERGYQQGALLRKEIEINLGYLYRQALKKFPIPELFNEVYDRMRPFIPQEYVDEMRGLAHGARVPLEMIHHIHILPEIGEWGGKKRLVKVVKSMMNGDPEDTWGTSCSNFCFADSAAKDRGFYSVRILDWGLHRISKLHKFPLITIGVPEEGNVYANIGWVGFLGAVSGMNAAGITLGEMGYGDPAGETLHGIPMPFLLRNVLTYASSLTDVRKILKEAPGTNSFIFMMTDGKKREGEIYIKDAQRFVTFRSGDRVADGKVSLAPIKDVLYGGHYNDRMAELFGKYKGELSPDFVMNNIIPQIGMPSNFQNVIYDPVNLRFWLANAEDSETKASAGPYTPFDLRAALIRF